ncbi:MAG TPA: hypothetical protein VGB25_05780 [Candidatus Binatia bacterium]
MPADDGKGGFNTETAEAFTRRLIESLNHGALLLMLSAGRPTVLFDNR